MIEHLRTTHSSRPRTARGFTLIELMISITIAVFLIGGALAIVGRTKNVFVAQNQLAQLQDNERLAMTFMAEVIESAGYFPSPKLYTAAAVMPVAGVFATSGQPVFGTYSAAAPGDTITVRFGAAPLDNVYGCTGVSNAAVAPYDTYVNKFWINTPAAPLRPQLMCTFTNNAGTNPAGGVALINGGTNMGVTNLAILYGIKRNPANTGSCSDTYLNASQMLAADWQNVCSVAVTVTFDNPLIPAQPITIRRVIAVMTTAGVNS